MRRRSTPDDSPARQLAGFIAKYDRPVGQLARSARAKLRARMPGAVELVYDNYNALAIGYGPTERASDALISLAVYPRWRNLYFLQGASLHDPDGLLQGSGRQGRYIRLESADEMDAPAVRALIDAAIEASKVPLPLAPRGRTITMSVSAKQRSRRPDRKDG